MPSSRFLLQDESHSLKNNKTARTKAAIPLLKVGQRSEALKLAQWAAGADSLLQQVQKSERSFQCVAGFK